MLQFRTNSVGVKKKLKGTVIPAELNPPKGNGDQTSGLAEQSELQKNRLFRAAPTAALI